MTGAIDNTDLTAAANQTIKAINDLCGCFQITVNNNVSVGLYLEQTEGQEGGDPPEGAGPPDTGIADRKCQVAEILYDDIETILDNLVNNPLQVSWFNLVTFALVVDQWVEEGVLLVDTALDTFGWLQDLVVFLVSFDSVISYSDMLTEWQANKDCIIRGMWDAENPTEARVAIETELSALTQTELDFLLDVLLTNTNLNILFFSVGTSESVIDTFVGTVDCAAICEPCSDISMIYGSNLGDSPDRPGWYRFETESIASGGAGSACMQVQFECANVTINTQPIKQGTLNLDNNYGYRVGAAGLHDTWDNPLGGPLTCTNAGVYCGGVLGAPTYPLANVNCITIIRGKNSPAGPQWIDIQLQELTP